MINAIRAHLAEFGVTAAVGRKGIEELLRVIADPSNKRVPDVVRACLAALGSQLLSLKKQIWVLSNHYGMAPLQSNEQAP